MEQTGPSRGVDFGGSEARPELPYMARLARKRRESIERGGGPKIARILHGDLPDNVVLNPQTGIPVIIDFDESVAPSKQTNIDRNAFITHFKVKPA